MSNGDINAFLNDLFKIEGGGDPEVINQFGYIGKYQFGEDALIDLGYYKPDGTDNRTATGKFKYDWAGEWTGKNGIKSKEDFLHNLEAQDRAAREWVRLLCSRMKRYKLQLHIGKTIKGIEITESGIIAAAHLKGFGSAKHPGVIQFLKTDGEIDPKDGNKTPVSKYMRIFANYDLGCCGSLTTVFIDKDKKPMSGVGYQIKARGKVVTRGKTDADGATRRIEGLDIGTQVSILIERLEGGFKELKSFVVKEETAFVATLRSATRMVTTQLEKHLGDAGDYRRHSEVAGSPAAARQKQTAHSASGSGASAHHQHHKVDSKRNARGHPVAVVKAASPALPKIEPSAQKLEEILLRNAEYGRKGQALSGPVAAVKSMKGEAISSDSKKKDSSLGQCYKYVKIALLASGMVRHYLKGEAARDAGPELQKDGYRNLLDNPAHGLKSPYDAPVGAVIVYDVTDGSRWGHIEVRTSEGFASDYFSPRPRTTKNGQETTSTMSGRNRKVIGIWVKG